MSSHLPAPPHTSVQSIDLSAEGIRIDGALLEPLSVATLEDRLGQPRELDTESGGKVSHQSIWDALGLRVTTTPEGALIEVRFYFDPHWHTTPSASVPDGALEVPITVNGEPPLEQWSADELARGSVLATIPLGGWDAAIFLSNALSSYIKDLDFSARVSGRLAEEITAKVRAAEQPFGMISVAPVVKKVVKKASGKWKHTAVDEPTLTFASFPFKLAIIEELMYNQGVLEPRFDLADFAADRGARSFDPQSFGMDTIPAVRTWFRALEIPSRLASSVESLVIDGGNEVYHQLVALWDGEDDRFAIKSLKESDLEPFTSLRSVEDIAGYLGPRAIKALEARGIEVDGA